jgi:multidrug resistance efflux pump
MTMTQAPPTAQARRIAVTAVVVVVAVIAASWLWSYYELAAWTRDGRVRVDVADVAPDVSGLVTKVYVTDNMWVRQGQPLFVIDAARYQLALQQAEATYQQDVAAAERAAAAITQARAGEAQARTGVLAQQTLLVEARREDDRNHRLGGLVSTESAQQGASKVAQLEAAVAQAQAAQGQATAGIAEAKAALDQARAMVVQARAASDTAKLNLQRTAVVAPVDGFAANVQLRPGDYLAAGHPAFGIVDAASLHIEGYFEETKLKRIRVGDRATIQLMGDGRRFPGHVESISPGITDRERAPSGDLLANVNPTFNWVRLAQRIPVRIHIDRVPRDLLLIAGRTATVSLDAAPASAQRVAELQTGREAPR